MFALLHAVPTMIYGCAADGCVSFVNLRLREFVGSRAERLLGGDGPACWMPGTRAHRSKRSWPLSRRAAAIGFGIARVHRDQQYRVLIDCGEPRHAADGTFIGYVGSVTDITEHAQPADESAVSESRFRRIADAGFEGFVGSSADITDRSRAEDLIRQSEARFRVLFETPTWCLFSIGMRTGECWTPTMRTCDCLGRIEMSSKRAVCGGLSWRR